MHWIDPPPTRHDVVEIPILWIAILLSLLVHVAALWFAWPHLHMLAPDANNPNQSSSLAVQLTPRARETPQSAPAAPSPPAVAAAPPSPPAVAQAVPPPRVAPPRPRSKPSVPRRSTPPVIAQRRPAPLTVPPAPPVIAPPQPEPPTPEPAPPPPPVKPQPPPLETDLASYVEARRRARGESPSNSSVSPSSAESDKERLNRIVAENLGLNRTPTFGYDPQSAGGIFQITHVGYDDAQFWFFGMDRDIGRKAKQLIDVRKGSNPDMRTAVVRKMIEIIRQNTSGDFLWQSQRQGRNVRLSARPEDNAGLEDFIMREVFPEDHPGVP
jgi:outer membrane biosynthesis protein TonB